MAQERERGASFFVTEAAADSVFTPEDFSEEHRMIARTTADFAAGEVVPHIERLEHQDWELTASLLRKAGELGLLAADIPEAYEGLGMDKVSSSLITEYLTRAGSFALSFGAHVGIGTLPIVFFGTEDQKKRYLPSLASGARFSAYALTEPGSGSDALGAKTVARLSNDGRHYILNGQKQFITNSAFADLFIVYAKVDGRHFSAFIVERGFPGVSTGPEERKMGIKASSTRPLILEDVPVPVENLLGEVGKGHVIAFNILNIGRYKLAVGCVGAAKEALETSVRYAKVREQFGRPIADFPLIQGKIADMAIRVYAAESMAYRTTGAMDRALAEAELDGPEGGRKAARAIAEFAIECSINKVYGSEALDFVVDEGVQIHGGAGYIQDYAIERMYRDSRINRIFEGTNEINRLLIPGTLLKMAQREEIPLLAAAQKAQRELLDPLDLPDESAPFLRERFQVDMIRRLFLLTGGAAVQKYGEKIEEEQELLGCLGDLAIALYSTESAALRAEKSARGGKPSAELEGWMAAYIADVSLRKAGELATFAFTAMEEGDALRTALSAVRKLTRIAPRNPVKLRRDIARRVIEAQRYPI